METAINPIFHWPPLISRQVSHQQSEQLSINLSSFPHTVVVVGSLQSKGRKITSSRRRRMPGRLVKSNDISVGHHIGKVSLTVHGRQGHEITRHQIWTWGMSKNRFAKHHGPRRAGRIRTVKALATVLENCLDALLQNWVPRFGKEKPVLASR